LIAPVALVVSTTLFFVGAKLQKSQGGAERGGDFRRRTCVRGGASRRRVRDTSASSRSRPSHAARRRSRRESTFRRRRSARASLTARASACSRVGRRFAVASRSCGSLRARL